MTVSFFESTIIAVSITASPLSPPFHPFNSGVKRGSGGRLLNASARLALRPAGGGLVQLTIDPGGHRRPHAAPLQ